MQDQAGADLATTDAAAEIAAGVILLAEQEIPSMSTAQGRRAAPRVEQDAPAPLDLTHAASEAYAFSVNARTVIDAIAREAMALARADSDWLLGRFMGSGEQIERLSALAYDQVDRALAQLDDLVEAAGGGQ